MPEHHPFRRAVELGDLDLLQEALTDDVVFHSPALFRPFTGRETAVAVLEHVSSVLTDFEYVHELAGPGVLALHFTATVGDRTLEGVDLLELDGEDRITMLTVFMRPQSALQAFSDSMAQRLGLAPPATTAGSAGA
jgi:SnoaL-like domain